MKTVNIIQSDIYSASIEKVFADKELAQIFADATGTYFSEIEITESLPQQILAGLKCYQVNMNRKGLMNPQPQNVGIINMDTKPALYGRAGNLVMTFFCLAKDVKDATKQADEYRLRMINDGSWAE